MSLMGSSRDRVETEETAGATVTTLAPQADPEQGQGGLAQTTGAGWTTTGGRSMQGGVEQMMGAGAGMIHGGEAQMGAGCWTMI